MGLNDGVEQSAVLGTDASLVYGATDLAVDDIDFVARSARVLQFESGWDYEAQDIGTTVSNSTVLLDFLR